MRACQLGFALLAFALAAQFVDALLTAAAAALTAPPGPPGEVDLTPITPPRWTYIWNAVLQAGLSLPAAAVLFRHARTPRWQRAALGAAALVVVQAAAILAVGALRVPGEAVTRPEPFVVQLLIHAVGLSGWAAAWCVLVIVSQFALACRATTLVERTERLGYAILWGVGCEAALAAWTLPRPELPADRDGVTALLLLARMIFAIAVFLGLLRVLSVSAALARHLAVKCDEVARPAAAEPGRSETPA